MHFVVLTFVAAELNILEPGNDISLEAWWSAARELVHMKNMRSFAHVLAALEATECQSMQQHLKTMQYRAAGGAHKRGVQCLERS
jgi:hypothetical protein